jgi:hypothetical protein
MNWPFFDYLGAQLREQVLVLGGPRRGEADDLRVPQLLQVDARLQSFVFVCGM